MADKAEEAAAAAAAQILEAERAEGQESSASSEETAAEGTPQDAEQAPSLDPELPEGLAEELDEPDLDEDEDPAGLDEDYEGYSEADQEIVKRLHAAEKKAAYYEDLRLKDSKKLWTAEAKKFFPLSEFALPSIEATSRRAFLKQARAAHETVKPLVKRYLDAAHTSMESEREQMRSEEREKAAKSWGRPSVGSEVPANAAEDVRQIERARARGDLSDVIRAMVFPKKG